VCCCLQTIAGLAPDFTLKGRLWPPGVGLDIKSVDFPVGYPVNPRHCTGVIGRGGLGKWGPNFAADAMLFRRNPKDMALEVLLIKRADSGDWALPGGMVDSHEYANPIQTAARELIEETLTGKQRAKEVSISICNSWGKTKAHAGLLAMLKTMGDMAPYEISFSCKDGKTTCKEDKCEMKLSPAGMKKLSSSGNLVYAGLCRLNRCVCVQSSNVFESALQKNDMNPLGTPASFLRLSRAELSHTRISDTPRFPSCYCGSAQLEGVDFNPGECQWQSAGGNLCGKAAPGYYCFCRGGRCTPEEGGFFGPAGQGGKVQAYKSKKPNYCT